MQGYAMITATIIFNMFAHSFMKVSSKYESFNLYFLIGIGFFGVSVIFYRMSLKFFELNKAFLMLNGISYVIIGVISVLIFRESMTWKALAGYVLVIMGITVSQL